MFCGRSNMAVFQSPLDKASQCLQQHVDWQTSWRTNSTAGLLAGAPQGWLSRNCETFFSCERRQNSQIAPCRPKVMEGQFGRSKGLDRNRPGGPLISCGSESVFWPSAASYPRLTSRLYCFSSKQLDASVCSTLHLIIRTKPGVKKRKKKRVFIHKTSSSHRLYLFSGSCWCCRGSK